MAKSKNQNLYRTVVPLILLGLAALTFLIASLSLSIWSQPLHRVGVLAALSLEMYFLPYALLPFVTRLPTLWPWVTYDPVEEFGIDGEDRLRQRSIVAAFLLMVGVTTLAAFGAAPAGMSWQMEIAYSLFLGAFWPVRFAILAAVILALPDMTPFLTWVANLSKK